MRQLRRDLETTDLSQQSTPQNRISIPAKTKAVIGASQILMCRMLDTWRDALMIDEPETVDQMASQERWIRLTSEVATPARTAPNASHLAFGKGQL